MSSERFQDLLPWYVNGTIDDDDRLWMDQYLTAHPQAQAEVNWYQSLQQRMRDSIPAVPATLGLAQTLARIRGDQPTWAERLRAFFGNFGLRPGLALAGWALVIVQSGVIFSMRHGAQDDAAQIRALRATPVEEGPVLKVNFAPTTTESDLRHLLMQVQGDIVGGPGQLGDYYLRVPEGTQARALTLLQAQPQVQGVVEVPGVPPRQ